MGKPNPQNLKPMKKGEKARNPNGRPKKLVNALKELPIDMQEKVYGVLAKALTFESRADAISYIQNNMGEFGLIMDIAVKRLTSDQGWETIMDIMDRLYGKPRQSAEVTHRADGLQVIVKSDDERAKIESLGNLGV